MKLQPLCLAAALLASPAFAAEIKKSDTPDPAQLELKPTPLPTRPTSSFALPPLRQAPTPAAAPMAPVPMWKPNPMPVAPRPAAPVVAVRPAAPVTAARLAKPVVAPKTGIRPVANVPPVKMSQPQPRPATPVVAPKPAIRPVAHVPPMKISQPKPQPMPVSSVPAASRPTLVEKLGLLLR